MKIKCLKAECETGHIVGSMQIFLNRNGEVKYSRIRHYIRSESGKPKFSYCPQRKTYAETKLKEYLSSKNLNTVSTGSTKASNNDQLGHSNVINIDPKRSESSSKSEKVS